MSEENLKDINALIDKSQALYSPISHRSTLMRFMPL